MAKRKSTSKPRTTGGVVDLHSNDVILFQGGKGQGTPGTVQLQSLGSISDKLFGRTVEDVKADFDRISAQLTEVLSSAFSTVTQGMRIDSVEIALGFTAEGRLAFVAKAGIETTVTVTLKRV